MSRPFQSLAIIVLCGAVAGCQATTYIVEMRPDGDEFERTTRRVVTGVRIAAQPGGAERTAPREVFRTRFTSEVPADMEGNAGTYQRWISRMGEVTAYAERFPGDDDLLGQVETLRGAVDGGIDLLVGWFEHELGREPGWDELRVFLDERLRRDAANVALHLWAARADVDNPAMYPQTLMRTGRYLAERGYFKDEEAPRLMRLFLEAQETEAGARRFSEYLRRFIADRMGVEDDEPIPDGLAFLASNQQAKASFDAYTEARGIARDGVQQVLESVAMLLDFGAVAYADVRFSGDAAPTWTNGEWDAAQSRVTWHRRIDRQLAPPAFAYAVWTTPDEAFQAERFGEVLLTGRELVYYVFWRDGLSESEAAEWDELLDSLEPGEESRRHLAQFRFSGEDADADRSYAAHPVRLILERMEGTGEE